MRAFAIALMCLLFSGVQASGQQSAGLRGSTSARASAATPTSGAAVTQTSTLKTPAPMSMIPSDALSDENTPVGDPGLEQCRRSCAETYYFCLSGDGADDCPQNWTSCLADCSRGQNTAPSAGE